MRRTFIFIFALFIFLSALATTAQDEASLLAPQVFLRGQQRAEGVRYTASFIKPQGDVPLRNVSVEITLPVGASFTEMFVSQQIEFDVVRVSRQGAITFIWQVSRVAADTPLDSVSFTTEQPLAGPAEFFITWQNEAGDVLTENFAEVPPLIEITSTEATVNTRQLAVPPSYALVGTTGVQASAPTTLGAFDLQVRVLSADFNPPPEVAAAWWCSALEIVGLPAGATLDVIVPLRRPVAPFTPLVLFQQQADGSWLQLESAATVTADGQYAIYTHPGGLVVTGGDPKIQPAVLTEEEVQIIGESSALPTADPLATLPPDAPSSEMVLLPAGGGEPTQPAVTDGTSNTVIIGEGTGVPTEAGITDGTSNTIIVGEGTPAATLLPEVLPTLPDGTPVPTLAPVTDGTSDTIIVGESTATQAGITDGTSNTIIVGESTATLLPFLASETPAPTLAPVTDGTSNTIIVGEGTATASLVPSLPESSPAPTLIPVTDGTSNTVIVGESTATQAVITDGTSNTIVVGESTPAPTVTLLSTLLFTPAPVTATLVPTNAPTSTPIFQTIPVANDRVILVVSGGSVIQCQAGQINCARVLRTRGTRP